MPLAIQPEVPPLRADASGAVRVGGTRVLFVQVVRAFQADASPKDIVEMYDVLTLADVYGASAYHLRHPAEVEAHLAEYDQKANEVRRKIEEREAHLPDIRARIVASRALRGNSG